FSIFDLGFAIAPSLPAHQPCTQPPSSIPPLWALWTSVNSVSLPSLQMLKNPHQTRLVRRYSALFGFQKTGSFAASPPLRMQQTLLSSSLILPFVHSV